MVFQPYLGLLCFQPYPGLFGHIMVESTHPARRAPLMKERSMDHEACPETKLYYGIFAEPGAYPYPFGSECVGWLDTVDDAVLRGLPFGRLRDQAVAVDAVCAEWKGRYLELEACAKLGGWTPQF